MLAPHLADALHEAARLINTAAGPRGGQHCPDQLETPAALSELLPAHQVDANPTSLKNVKKLRTRLTEIWTALAAADLSTAQNRINTLLTTHGPVHLQLDTTDQSRGRASAHWVMGGTGRTGLEQFLGEMVMALAETAVAGEIHRLKLCAGTDCENALVDVTRNSSKQFCDEANCANRTHVRAYRERQNTGTSTDRRRRTTAASPQSSAAAPTTAASSTQPNQDAQPAAPEPSGETAVEKADKISKKITKLSTQLKDPQLSKKERKKAGKKFKKLRKELKNTADISTLEQAAKKK